MIYPDKLFSILVLIGNIYTQIKQGETNDNQMLSKRIHRVFLPTRSLQELNMIEVKGGYGYIDKQLTTPPFEMNMI